MPCFRGTFKMVCREPGGPADLEYSNLSLKLLEILRNLAFVSARFGYASFDEWNFVYFASIDLLCGSPPQVWPSSIPIYPVHSPPPRPTKARYPNTASRRQGRYFIFPGHARTVDTSAPAGDNPWCSIYRTTLPTTPLRSIPSCTLGIRA